MKTVIFAGGLGSRISEESYLKPKPMIEIGGKPILWHILKIYQSYGFDEFIICLGYKGYVVKEYFTNYFLHNSDITFDLSKNEMEIHSSRAEKLRVTLVDTGMYTSTAGRLKRVEKFLVNDKDENFMLTYGDGVSNIDLKRLYSFHLDHGKLATVTGVQPAGKFGVIDVGNSGSVESFSEKPKHDGTWINGGFFVLNKKIFQLMPEETDNIMWEQEPLKRLVEHNELMMYKHSGFWKCMDILRDKVELEKMWDNNPPWKIW